MLKKTKCDYKSERKCMLFCSYHYFTKINIKIRHKGGNSIRDKKTTTLPISQAKMRKSSGTGIRVHCFNGSSDVAPEAEVAMRRNTRKVNREPTLIRNLTNLK